MSSVDGCVRCGSKLAPDQEYCLECGARQTPAARPQWRRALIAAALTVALTVLVLVLGYERMRDDAEGDAAASHSQRNGALKQAGASGPAGGSESRRPVPSAQLAAPRSP
jgi:predicted nucleic acid-binding Zn ribbon protein